jgi:hypothetical protein
MHEGGTLVVGNKETLPSGDFSLTPWAEKWGVYRKQPPALSSLSAMGGSTAGILLESP